MLMPGRHANTVDYRYGFQGQEMDDEIKGEGNSINYKYRMHDPRVGRFFTIDPLTAKYPYYSPYSFSGNKVIHAIELEGLEEIIFNDNMINYGDMIMNVVSHDKVLVELYDRVQDQNKCHIKLYIASIDPSKINKRSNWGGRTYDHARLKILARNMQRVEKYISDTEAYDKKNGTTTKKDRKTMKEYAQYKAIFDAFGIQKEDVLNETNVDYNLILINENDLSDNNLHSLTRTVTHEIDAHFEENINGNQSVNNSHHYKYFDYDANVQNVSDEVQAILEVLKKGSSPPPSQYKTGSEADLNNKAIERAIEKIKEKEKELKKKDKKNG